MHLHLENTGFRERDMYCVQRLLERFGGRRLDSIHKPDINRYKAERRLQGVSDSTIRKELLCFQTAINYANNELSWRIDNPIKGSLPPKGESRVRWISFEEYQRLIASCSNKAPYLPDMITLAAYTGMRTGEILNLEWRRVDLAQSVIHLDRSDQKNKKYGVIVLNATARTLLRRIFRNQVYVFEKNGNPIGSIKTAFKTAVTKAGIENFHFHDLRHTFASWYLQAGGNLAKLQTLMRHASIDQTMIYAHLELEHVRGDADLLDSIGEKQKLRIVN